MKFKTLTLDFVKNITLISKVITKSNINPLFECVFLKIENNTLIIRGTNLEVVAEANIAVKGEINGQVMLKPETLVKVLNNIINSTLNLNIELNENVLIISDDNDNEYEFEIFGKDEIPKLPTDLSNVIELKKEQFTSLIKSVIFCASKSDIKPEISSVYIYKNNDTLVSVATDSYRLAEKTIYISNISEKEFSVILPQKNIINILPIIDDMNEDITIESYSDGILIKDSKISVATRIVNGNFPDYRQLFPKEFIFEIDLNKQVLLKSLQISNIMNSEYSFCEFDILKEKSKVFIKAKGKSIGNVKSYIDFKVEKGEVEELSVNYNSNYFLEGVQKMHGENILLKYTVQNKPLFINSNSDLSFKYLLMPLNR